MFLNPPLDSVPNLMRPVGPSLSGAASCVVLNVPSRNVPRSNPDTCEFVMVTFSVARLNPSAYELFKTIASSFGEFTNEFEILTFRQASISRPSRFVSILRLSIVRLSTPVASNAKWPPCETVKSLSVTFRTSFRAIALLPCPSISLTSDVSPRGDAAFLFPPPRLAGVSPAVRGLRGPGLRRVRPRPSIRPWPTIATFSMPIPQKRLFFQCVCPKSWYASNSFGSGRS
jgi:hypothetical protein